MVVVGGAWVGRAAAVVEYPKNILLPLPHLLSPCNDDRCIGDYWDETGDDGGGVADAAAAVDDMIGRYCRRLDCSSFTRSNGHNVALG